MTQPQPIPPLTKREYFASLALQGLLNNQYTVKLLLKETRGNYELIPGLLAQSAVRIADTLMEQLERNSSS
jgi:hypothetical protein